MKKILVKNIEITYQESDGTLLQCLEKNGFKTYSMCREGFCNTCCIKLLEGEIDYISEPISLLLEDEILPCICKPKTDIKVDL